MRKSPHTRDAKLMSADAYNGSAEAFWTWQRESGLSDKALARLAGVSPNTVRSNRQRGELFGLKTLYRMRDALPPSWWDMIVGRTDHATDRAFEARAVALETRLQQLRDEYRRAKGDV